MTDQPGELSPAQFSDEPVGVVSYEIPIAELHRAKPEVLDVGRTFDVIDYYTAVSELPDGSAVGMMYLTFRSSIPPLVAAQHGVTPPTPIRIPILVGPVENARQMGYAMRDAFFNLANKVEGKEDKKKR